jgi:drug/metabolite transporter (DMT)-like permease
MDATYSGKDSGASPLVVSLAWNLVLLSTGRRVLFRDIRGVWVAGMFFGLNLVLFFAGAKHSSVANAALIGARAPFLIVPVSAWLFRERIDTRALLFALVAFGGLALVLLSAPPGGDASLKGNVFGVVAMFLLVGYVASARYFGSTRT